MLAPDFVQQFQSTGAELCRGGLVSRHGGNLSIRLGDSIWITGHGCGLGSLDGEDIIETGVSGEPDPRASMEAQVHRAIYRVAGCSAIVHAHPTHAIAFSFKLDEIVPPDIEGELMLGRVPVVQQRLGPGEGGDAIASALRGHKAVLVRGHGCFSLGRDLGEAGGYAQILEESCRILFLMRGLGL